MDLDKIKGSENSTQSARNYQVKVLSTGDWMQRNTPPILALICVLATFGFFFYLVRVQPEGLPKDIVMFILGVLSTISTQVISYYFGSSVGSKMKDKLFNENSK